MGHSNILRLNSNATFRTIWVFSNSYVHTICMASKPERIALQQRSDVEPTSKNPPYWLKFRTSHLNAWIDCFGNQYVVHIYSFCSLLHWAKRKCREKYLVRLSRDSPLDSKIEKIYGAFRTVNSMIAKIESRTVAVVDNRFVQTRIGNTVNRNLNLQCGISSSFTV